MPQTGRMTSPADRTADRDRPIRPDERSGVLHPQHLRRYDARWFDPDPAVGSVVDRYWQVRWHLPDGESIDQRIIDLPAVTLTIEEGSVPAPLVVTGLHRRAWTRRISGAGSVFAIRLRPAGLAVLGDVPPHRLADATVPLTPRLDTRLHAPLSGLAVAPTPGSRVRAADAAIRDRMVERPPSTAGLLANDVLDELSARVRTPAATSLAENLGVGERTVQRALRTTLGRGPTWVARRLRLQEVARVLASDGAPDLATLAGELGYTDQAHLTNDFRTTSGLTPAAYARSVRAVTGP